MIERQIDQHINEMAMRMSYQGLKLDDFLKYTGQTMEQLRGLCREREEAGSGGGCARRHPYRGKPGCYGRRSRCGNRQVRRVR